MTAVEKLRPDNSGCQEKNEPQIITVMVTYAYRYTWHLFYGVDKYFNCNMIRREYIYVNKNLAEEMMNLTPTDF